MSEKKEIRIDEELDQELTPVQEQEFTDGKGDDDDDSGK